MFAAIQGISMVVYILILTLYAKKYNFPRVKSFLAAVAVVIVDMTTIFLLTWIESGFKDFGAQNAVRIFVITPLWIYIISKVTHLDYRKLCDYHAAPAVTWFAVGHIACIFQGCCHGYAYYEGTTMCKLATTLTGTNMLPQQLLETVSAFLIGIILFAVARKYNYNVKGYLYNIMLIVYGTQRFFWEFLRDNEKVIVFSDMTTADGQFGISSLALWSVAMVVVGAVLLAISVHKDKKEAKLAKADTKFAA